MKRHLLFAMLCIVGALGFNAQAQGPSNGDYYLQNVSSGLYLGGENSWGTQAAVCEQGVVFTLTSNGSTYSILHTGVTVTNKYLGSNLYTDSTDPGWTIEAVSGEEGVYAISTGGQYLAQSTTAGAYTGYTCELVGSITDAAKWYILTRDEAIAKLSAASETSPMSATFLIKNPGFNRNVSTANWTMVASNQNLSGGDDGNRCAESWRATFTLSQTISVPNGKYQLRAQAALTEYTVTGADFPVVYINDGTSANEVSSPFKTMQNGETSMATMSTQFTNGNYFTDWTDVITVTGGSITIGVRGTRTDTWCIWDNFQLRYLGALDLSGLATVLQEAVDAGKALTDPMNQDVEATLTTAISTYDDVTYDNAEDYQAAIDEVTAAVNAARTSIANYAAYAAYETLVANLDADGQASWNANADVTPIQSAYNARTFVSLTSAQETALTEALRTAAKAQTTPGADMTLAIVNPTVDGITGWTVSRPLGGNGPLLNGTAMEYWAGNASDRTNASFDYYQTITGLPNGTYTVSAEMYNSLNGEDGATFNASSGVYGTSNDTQSALVDVDGTTLTRYTTPEITVLNGTLRIGVKNFESMGARWFVADNFQLTYVGPIADLTPYVDAYLAALAAAKETAATTDRIAPSVLSALNNTITTYDEDQVDQTSQAALEEATAALISANTLAQKSIASYKVIDQGFVPDDSLEGWVCENTQTFHINTWSTEGNPGNDPSGMVTPFIENWVGKGSYLGAGKVYYRLEGLEPGEVYRVSALVRSYNEADETAPNGPNFYVLNDVADLTEVGTTFTYNGMSGIYGTQTAAATIGSDGILELGVVIAENRNYNWVAFKNITIATYDDMLAAAIAAVEAYDGKVPTGAYAEAQALIDACTGNNYPDTAEEFETAIEALSQKAADLEALVEAYNAYLELKDYADALVAAPTDNTTAQSTLATAISTAETNIAAATTAEAETAVNDALKAAMVAYAAAANPTDETQPFNLTFMFVNPNLEGLPTWAPCDGWYTEQPDGNSQVMTNDYATSEDGTKTAFYEYWSYTAKANGLFTLYQPVTLPEGTYSMSCYAFAKQQDDPANTGDVKGVYFYANNTQGSVVDTDRLSAKTIEFVNSAEQEVKIGLKAINPNSYNWMGIGYLELYKVPAKAIVIDQDDDDYDYTQEVAGDVILRRPIKVGYNTLVLPFSMTQDEVEQTFGEGSTISVLASYDVEKEHLRFSKQNGVVANRPCLLNATQAIAEGTDIEIPARTLVANADAFPVFSVENATMTGTYEMQTPVPENSWFVQNGSLVYAPDNTSCWVNLTRAYITLADGATPVKGLSISFDDGTTGIAVIENGEMNILTGKIYDLSGREVQKPTRGIYIVNGKKVMIK